MAVTRIHPIKVTIQRSIDYICNPHKTDNQILVSTFACSPRTAEYDFRAMLDKANSTTGENKAFHLIQSFMPGEVSFDEAHQIGEELMNEVLKEKYSYVHTTHIDKDHIHNHFIFCAVDNFNHDRYLDNKRSYKQIRSISDKLCKEHELSIVVPGVSKGKSYAEWRADKEGYSIKSQLKIDIFDCIKHAKDYEDFLLLMKNKGYEIKGSELGENAAKYISFKPSNYKYFMRGSYRTLGKGYTKEEIIERIDKQIASRLEWQEKQKNMKVSDKKYVDTSGEAFKNSPGLTRWGNITNLQIAASLYAEIGSIAELKEQIELNKRTISDTRSSIARLDKDIKSLGEIIKYAKQYEEYKHYATAYESSKNPDAYLRSNETNLLFFEGAKNYLESAGINVKNLDINKLVESYDSMQEERSNLKKLSESAIKERDENEKKLKKFEEFIGSNSADINNDKDSRKKRNEQAL